MKLQARVMLVVVPVIVVPMLAVGLMIHNTLRDNSSDRSLQQMAQLLDQAQLSVDDAVRAAEANLKLFAGSTLLEDYLLTNDEMQRYTLLQPPLLRAFSTYQNAYPEYEQLQVLLPNGFEDSRTTSRDLDNQSDDEQGSPLFKQLQAHSEPSGKPYTVIMRDADSGQMTLKAALALHYRDPATEPVGVTPSLKGYLVLTVSLDFLRRQAAMSKVGESGHIRFLGNDGSALFPEAGGPMLGGIKQLPNQPGQWQQVHDSQDPANLLIGGRIRHDLLVIGVLPQKQLLAASREVSQLVVMVTLIIIAVMTGLLLTFLRIMVISPLTELSNASKEVGRGNLMALVRMDRKDEIGELGNSFNHMIQDLISSSDKIRDLAYRDALTRLPNRHMLMKQLDQALSRAQRANRHLALMFLDIDNFKQINDLHGHDAGDALLVHIAKSLEYCLRTGDTIAMSDQPLGADSLDHEGAGSMVGRLGGDEFLLLLPEITDIMDTEKVARRILTTLAEPYRIGDTQMHIGTSIGITTYPQDGETADTLMRNADMAMYHAKAEGKNNYQYFSEDLSRAVVERLDIETRLRDALENGQLAPQYQPQFDVANGNVLGVELLLRWHDDELGWISPATFIPIAEDCGLIVPITAWLLNEAARQISIWNAAGLDYLTVSVNVSSIDVMRSNVAEMISTVLQEHAIAPQQLAIELTETTIMTGHRKPTEALEAIKALGVAVYLDDFGTGYASLSYLSRFPFDKVKIDRSFVDGLPHDRENVAIVRAIVALARSLDLTITAEGIENQAQLQFLQAEGCDDAQGWLFSQALTADELQGALTSDPGQHPWKQVWQNSEPLRKVANL